MKAEVHCQGCCFIIHMISFQDLSLFPIFNKLKSPSKVTISVPLSIPPSLTPTSHVSLSFIQDRFGQHLCIRHCACSGYEISKGGYYSPGGPCSSETRHKEVSAIRTKNGHGWKCGEGKKKTAGEMQRRRIRGGSSRISSNTGRFLGKSKNLLWT